MGQKFFSVFLSCALVFCVSCAIWRHQEVRPGQYKVVSNARPPLQVAPIASADADNHEVVNRNRIYYGDCDDFTRPACLSLKRVFLEIPEYRTILQRRLTCKDSRYWIFINTANEVFRKVVRGVASEHKYDLIGEKGSIRSKTQEAVVPDATHFALLYLRRLTEK